MESIDKIPDIIKALKVSVNTNGQNIMANPNENFNETDVVEDENLPFRRLLFAGKSREYCFIYCEVGGFGYHLSFILFQIHKNKLIPVLALTMFNKKKSVEQLKESISDAMPILTINDALKNIKQNKNKEHKIDFMKYDVNALNNYGF